VIKENAKRIAHRVKSKVHPSFAKELLRTCKQAGSAQSIALIMEGDNG